MKKGIFYFKFLFLFIGLAYANTFENVEEAYKAACGTGGYSRSYCDRVRYRDKWTEPKKEISKALKIMRPKIKEMAKEFDIDPRFIVASILTENSVNVKIDDKLQDWLVNVGIAEDGSIFGKSFSFGWGQLYIEAAMEAEKVIAKKEKRKMLPRDKVASLLLTPNGAMKYAAALNKHNIDTYKNCICDQDKNPEKVCGFDISNDLSAVATLYNIGNPGKYCRRSLKAKRKPRPNFFGLWAWAQENTINEIVGPPDQNIDFSFELDSNVLAEIDRKSKIKSLDRSINLDPYIKYGDMKNKFESKWKGFKDPSILDFLKDDNGKHKSFYEVLFERPQLKKKKDEEETKLFINGYNIKSMANADVQDITKKAYGIKGDEKLNSLKLIGDLNVTSVPEGCLNSKRDRDKLVNHKIKKDELIMSVTDERVCRNDRFVLVTTSSGKIGWINKAVLMSKSKLNHEKKLKQCKFNYNSSCKEKIEFESRMKLKEDLSLGGIVFEIPEIRGGDYKSDSCRYYSHSQRFQSELQKALGLLSSCVDIQESLSEDAQKKIIQIGKVLNDIKYLDFQEIGLELSTLAATCKVNLYTNDDENLSKDDIFNIMCNEKENNPFLVESEYLNLQRKMSIIANFSNNKEQASTLIDANLENLYTKVLEISKRKSTPECKSLWRDKTKKYIKKLEQFSCIKAIELPNLDIGADYYSSSRFRYIPSDNNKIIFRTSELSCE